MLFVTDISFARTVARTTAALRVRNTEVSVIGISLFPVGVVMCDRPGSHFRTSPLLYANEKGWRSANIVLGH